MKTFSIKIIVCTSMILFSSCTRKDITECPENLLCTEVFASIGVQILNKNNETIKLSKTITEIEGASSVITKTDFSFYYDGYVIIDDLSKRDLKKTGSTITFKGYDVNNHLIINEKYIIGHDCCHVIKMSGQDVILIN